MRSLFIKQQVMVPRMVAPMTRATPVPTRRGSSRVSSAGEKKALVRVAALLACCPVTLQVNPRDALQQAGSKSPCRERGVGG